MAMQVDQPWRHQLPRRIDGLQRASWGNLRLDRLNHAPADADVTFATQRLARIKHVAPFDHEVEFIGRAHRRVG